MGSRIILKFYLCLVLYLIFTILLLWNLSEAFRMIQCDSESNFKAYVFGTFWLFTIIYVRSRFLVLIYPSDCTSHYCVFHSLYSSISGLLKFFSKICVGKIKHVVIRVHLFGNRGLQTRMEFFWGGGKIRFHSIGVQS